VRHPLNPTLLSRVSRALRPNALRTLAARRIAAGALTVVAGITLCWPDPNGDAQDAVIAARDLRPGATVTATDVVVIKRVAAALPDGALGSLEQVLGAKLAGPTRRGEVLTDARVLGPRLAGLTVGPDAQIVPVQLVESAVLDLVRAGDVVDVVGAQTADSDTKPQIVARNAVVVLVSEKPKFADPGHQRVVLVALPSGAAHTLAGATLVQTVTLTIH
jgi:hypothetical protein